MFVEYQIEAADDSSSMKIPSGGSYVISVAGEDQSVNYLDIAEVVYVPDATYKLMPLSGVWKRDKAVFYSVLSMSQRDKFTFFHSWASGDS